MFDPTGLGLLPLDVLAEVQPTLSSGPVPCDYIEARISSRTEGGGTQPLAEGSDVDDKIESDADGRGWVVPPAGTRVEALFVVNLSQLGVGRADNEGPPVWLDLSNIRNVDAIGDVTDGLQEVEITLGDETTISAGWTVSFCERVVGALVADHSNHASTSNDAESSSDGHFSPKPVVRARSRRQSGPEPESEPTEADTSETNVDSGAVDDSVEPSTESADEDVEWSRAGALELEDVTYIGGYPGQTRRRKRCTAMLSNEGLEIAGPSELKIRLAWGLVESIEAQNADEARFRMNTKIHTDSSALVVSCQGDIRIVLEARDCPTIPLRSAINQLIGDLPVVVT